MLIFGILCMSVCATHICDAYKVLLVMPTPGKSHAILGQGVAKHLLNAGHEVTYITAFPKNEKSRPSLREIDMSTLQKFTAEEKFSIERMLQNEVDMSTLKRMIPMFHDIQVACLENDNVKRLLNDPRERFDVVIAEWMFVELISGISAVFNCPYIWLSTFDPHWMVLKLIDEIPNPAYTTSRSSHNVVPLSFLQRTEELLYIIFGHTTQSLYLFSTGYRDYERLLAPIIRKRGHRVPDFDEVRYNASLVLGNSHVSMGQATRLPQNYKVIGGLHIDSNTDPLPEDLKQLLDNAKHGFIYFSLGTMAKSKYFPSQLKVNILKILGNLKQTVLWKFEEDVPNRPSNVHIVHWAPQQSILAHRNCVLFITHGGQLSTMEAIHFAKPVIGIPLFADQFNNIEKCVKRGFAKRVDLSYNIADDLEKAINDILADPRYSANVKALSYIYHDRPVSPGKELVHWVEHVVRTGGAPHLRSPALTVPWYQKCYLDLVALCITILWTAMLVVKKIINQFSKKYQKTKTN